MTETQDSPEVSTSETQKPDEAAEAKPAGEKKVPAKKPAKKVAKKEEKVETKAEKTEREKKEKEKVAKKEKADKKKAANAEDTKKLVDILKRRKNGIKVPELAEELDWPQSKVRAKIDAARRAGHKIKNIGRLTFQLEK